MAFIQARLIIGGRKYWPDIGSEIISRFTGGFSHIETFVPAGLSWAPEGWLYSARSDTVPAAKVLSCSTPGELAFDPVPFYRGVAEAQRNGIPRGVQFRPPGYCTRRRCVVLTIPVTDAQFAAFWASQHDKLGRPYDWRSIVAFACPFGLTRDWHETDSWMCSEGYEDSMEKGEVLSAFWLAPYKISPGLAAARTEVLPGVWATEIHPLTDPRLEATMAMGDWKYHRG